MAEHVARTVGAGQFGAEATDDGVQFRLWAPSAKTVELLIEGTGAFMLPDLGDGWRTLQVANLGAGTRYRYRINGELEVPDPASRFQPDGVFGWSTVVDAKAYQWRARDWRGLPWTRAVIWEAHVGTATREGTYAALMRKLPEIAATGVTTIELMPLAECPGDRNWGYDGVLPFAPKSTYGTPDELRAFVDAAHELGLMVLIDVVYNHFGPSGNYLHAYAERFFTDRHPTPWGAGLNFDGAHGKPVRRFFIENALMWIEDYRVDGLRFDAVHAIRDDSDEHVLTEIARELRSAARDRHIHLLLENEHNEASWLARDGHRKPRLYTAQWNDDVHHCWHVLLTGEHEGYYAAYVDKPGEMLARALAEGFAYQGEPMKHTGRARGEPSGHLPPDAFVNFLQNHDQIGNRAFGERLTALADPEKLAIARAVLLLAPQIPMLYMGEEWGSRAPFRFFVDFSHDEALSKAVREGRQREFASFSSFSDETRSSTIPDPTSRRTFEESRIDWSERSLAPHAAVLNETTRLLDLRKQHVVPLLESGFLGAQGTSQDLINVRWRFPSGSLRLLLNVTEREIASTTEGKSVEIWKSPGVTRKGNSASLAPWSCLFLTEAAVAA